MSWNFGFWFLSGVGALICGVEGISALRTGRAFTGIGTAVRNRHPLPYWLTTGLYWVTAIALGWQFTFHHVESRERVPNAYTTDRHVVSG